MNDIEFELLYIPHYWDKNRPTDPVSGVDHFAVNDYASGHDTHPDNFDISAITLPLYDIVHGDHWSTPTAIFFHNFGPDRPPHVQTLSDRFTELPPDVDFVQGTNDPSSLIQSVYISAPNSGIATQQKGTIIDNSNGGNEAGKRRY